ncbi:MAG TPA: SMP-30/gluconolactonase/LRE family protein [Polyangia bacterium]|jgi:sugar lactone lactonase YvrE|nr:SMP-30/gluconolactonase/LRE family protein [Polyangia bacterium]
MNRTSLDHGVKPTRADVTCVLSAKAKIGEGPVWSVAEQRLYWADIVGKQLNVFNPADGSNKVFDLPELVTSISPRKSGGLILTLRSSFAFFDLNTGKLDKLAEPEPDRPGNRFNDGKCDRQGRMWGGTMGDVEWDQPVGNLYRFGADLKPVRVVEGICCSNGLGWSPDSKTMYFTESFAYRIWAYDFDAATGNVSNRRIFLKLDPHESAFPDGMTVDAEGYVWSAQPMFGRLARYAPDGKLERVIELPVSRGTSVMFGGPNLDVLYVTTMRETLSAAQLAEEPLAGSLLALRPGVKGVAETPFAG